MINFNKKILLLIILLILLTLQGVSAIDNHNSTQELQAGDNELLSANDNSFTTLQSLVDSGNSTINLEKDYIRYDGENTILISKNMTINGNGHIIDANNTIRAFRISADNVILNNVTIKSGNDKLAGAIYWEGENGILANSSFINNKATGTDTSYNYEGGGAVYWTGNNGLIANSTFESNSAGGHGGAVWWNGNNGIIENSVFIKNNASKWGGAIYSKGNNVNIRNNNFTSNKGSNGGSLSVIGEGTTIDNLIFNLSNGTLGGALYWNVPNGIIKNSKFYNCYSPGTTGGGAVYTTSSAVLTNFVNCIFENNTADKSGGAIYAYSKAIVTGSHFYNNFALNFGGAIFFNQESSEVNSSEFIRNKALKSGGAVYISNRFCVVNNSIFKNNTADYAGAIYFSSYKHQLFNSLFENNNATSDAGAVFLGSYGTVVDNATFISNSAQRGGALYNYVTGTTSTTKTEITNSEFKYNKATAGGAISSYAKFIDINGTDFTFNEANYGSAIFADRTSYTISNSTFLNNSADSVELILNVDDSEYAATAIYKVNNTLLNAIYRVEGSILLENVTYWGENGVSNSDDGYIEDIYAINQNVTLIVKNNANIEIYNVTGQTKNGNVIFKDLLFEPGNYTLQAIHYKDNYYTEIASNIQTLNITGVFSKLELVNDTIFYGENALVRVSDDATGTVSIFIGKYYIGEINNGLANISLEGLPCGTYGALISYSGDDYYDGSSLAAQIKIIDNSPGAYSYLKTEYTNTIQAGINNTLTLTVENIGIKSSKNVKIKILSENTEIADFIVEDYEAGNYYKFSFIDPVLRPLDESSVFNVTHKLANYTVVVEDENGLINSTNFTFPIIYNGYLGKDYAYPQEFNDKITRVYNITGDVIIVNSPYTKYASSTDTYRVENFTLNYRNDVAEALLYVPYNWDSIETGDYNRWHAVFNNNFVTPIAHYRDQANLGGYGNRGYGLVVYNVTEFIKSGNNLFELTKVRSGCAVYPSSLMVLTNNSLANTIKKVYITENADLLSKQYSLNSTVGKLTKLDNINNAFVLKSDLYVFAASAEIDEGNIIFNGNNITNVWQGNSSSLEMFTLDVSNDIEKNNVLFFEATGGTILSLHKIVVVESKLNVSSSANLKTEYTNTIQAGVNNTLTLTVVNNGTDDGKNIQVKVLSENTEIASFVIDNFVVGEDNVFTFVDTKIRPVDENTVYGAVNPLANYTVIVSDSSFTFSLPVRYNGYLGKDYAYPKLNNSEITREYEITGDVIIINAPDASYMSSSSTNRSETFIIENNSAIAEALLYIPYNWDNVATGDYLKWIVTINNQVITPIAHYRDQGNLGGYGNRGYGLVVYNITGFVNSGENEVILNKNSGGCAVYPQSVLILTNNASSNTVKKVYISENADLLSKKYSKSLTVGAKTIFEGIDITNSSKSSLYVFAASAQRGEGNIVFNNITAGDVWNASANSISVSNLDISDNVYKNNNLFFEATGDTILELHSIIVVESILPKKDLNIEASCEAITVGENATVVVSGLADATGIVSVEVNGVVYEASIVDGVASVVVSGLTENVTAVVSYAGDDRYNDASVSVDIVVYPQPVPPKENLTLVVSADPITVGENATVVVSGLADATGNVTVEVNGVVYEASIVDGVASVVVSGLTENVTAVVSYAGDDRYNNASASVDIVVYPQPVPPKEDLNVSISAEDITEGEIAVIEISGLADATGNITAAVNDKNYSTRIRSGGVAFIFVYDLTENATAVISYSGDDKYNNFTKSVNITVNPKEKVDSTINVNAEDIVEGETANVLITIPGDATGNVTVILNGESRVIDINSTTVRGLNGILSMLVTYENLTAGNYTVIAVYSGNNNYNPSNATATFVVGKTAKENATMDIDVSPVTEGQNVTVNVELPEDATGTVNAFVNGKNYTVPLKDGKATITIPKLAAGNYTIPVTYSGDDKYNSETEEVNVTVKEDQKSNIIKAPDVTKYFRGSERFVVTVTDYQGSPLANKTVVININGASYTRNTDANGTASIALGLNSGVYNATVTVDSNTINSVVTILPTVNGSDVVKMYRNATQYYATFLDSEGKYLADGTVVRFNINGVMYDRMVSGGKGLARLNINLEQGKYIITTMNTVTGENTANNITVLSLITENRDVTKYYRNATQYTVKVLGEDGKAVGAGVTVRFNINGVFYERQTDASGIAKLNINLQAGDYIITAEYNGCMVSNNIKILPILNATDVSMKYRDGTQFKANLVDGQGKPCVNQVVTFNINGVFYNRITDASGQAKLNINLMPGEYIITSSYNGSSIANTIKISA